MSESAQNLSAILARIDAARKTAVAPAPATSLIAVSKTHDAAAIRPVLEGGHRIFGENRVQEALAKWPPLQAGYAGVELHLIGPLQSNKTREAVGLFDAIHSLDRPKLAHALKAEIERSGSRAGRCSYRSTPARSRKRPASRRRTPPLSSRSAGTN